MYAVHVCRYQAIGAPGYTNESGIAYVRSGTTAAAPGSSNRTDPTYTYVMPPSITPGQAFGHSIALRWPYLVVGAPNMDVANVSNVGAAYLFKHDYEVRETATGLPTIRLMLLCCCAQYVLPIGLHASSGFYFF